MKNEQKAAIAQQVLAQAKELGFENAYITFCDEEGTLFESVEDVARETLDGECTVSVHLVLDEELSFLVEDEQDTGDPNITFVS
jgi:hypothetical protein